MASKSMSTPRARSRRRRHICRRVSPASIRSVASEVEVAHPAGEVAGFVELAEELHGRWVSLVGRASAAGFAWGAEAPPLQGVRGPSAAGAGPRAPP
jgi:hypothetical protein